MHHLTWVVMGVIISIACAQKVVPLPQDLLDKVRPVEEQCIKETGSVPDSLHHMLAWTLPGDMNSKKFVQCFALKTGYGDESGRIVLDKFTVLIKDYPDSKDDFVSAVNECNKNAVADLTESLYKMAGCFNRNSPIIYSLEKRN